MPRPAVRRNLLAGRALVTMIGLWPPGNDLLQSDGPWSKSASLSFSFTRICSWASSIAWPARKRRSPCSAADGFEREHARKEEKHSSEHQEQPCESPRAVAVCQCRCKRKNSKAGQHEDQGDQKDPGPGLQPPGLSSTHPAAVFLPLGKRFGQCYPALPCNSSRCARNRLRYASSTRGLKLSKGCRPSG